MTQPPGPTDPPAPRDDGAITEEWLRASGFKWEQLDRQPHKHWILKLGSAIEKETLTDADDLMVELSDCAWPAGWYCWIRGDFWGRYARLIHVRHMHRIEEVTRLIEALTGLPWNPADVLYGCLRRPEDAARLRADADRLDRRIAASQMAAAARRLNRDPDQRGEMRE